MNVFKSAKSIKNHFCVTYNIRKVALRFCMLVGDIIEYIQPFSDIFGTYKYIFWNFSISSILICSAIGT
jgi:hypothetical protein